MIEKIEDLDVSKSDSIEDVEKVIIEKLGVSFQDMIKAVCNSVQNNAEKLTEDFVNIVPNGDYSLIIEDTDGMAEFLKTEAAKESSWKIESFAPDAKKPMIQFVFANTVVDEGESFKGYVYVSFSGVIRHAFAQVE
jgi:hypothetical protein